MPRNGSGTYTLPSGNPVVANTTIEANWANTTLDDVGNEITESLSRNGEGGMLAPLRTYAGTASVPGVNARRKIYFYGSNHTNWCYVYGD